MRKQKFSQKQLIKLNSKYENLEPDVIYPKIKTAEETSSQKNSGVGEIVTEENITSIEQLRDLLQSGNYELIQP